MKTLTLLPNFAERNNNERGNRGNYNHHSGVDFYNAINNSNRNASRPSTKVKGYIMKSKELFKPILIINREDGQVEWVITNELQYREMYNYMLCMNDINTAINVFSDFTGQTVDQLLKDFNLVELINCFSTRYQAQVTKPKRRTIEYKNQDTNVILKLKI